MFPKGEVFLNAHPYYKCVWNGIFDKQEVKSWTFVLVWMWSRVAVFCSTCLWRICVCLCDVWRAAVICGPH